MKIRRHLSPSQKKRKNTDNYRWITLRSSVYNVLSAMILKRLKPIGEVSNDTETLETDRGGHNWLLNWNVEWRVTGQYNIVQALQLCIGEGGGTGENSPICIFWLKMNENRLRVIGIFICVCYDLRMLIAHYKHCELLISYWNAFDIFIAWS